MAYSELIKKLDTLRNYIRRNVEDNIAALIIDSIDNPLESVNVEVKDGELSIK